MTEAVEKTEKNDKIPSYTVPYRSIMGQWNSGIQNRGENAVILNMETTLLVLEPDTGLYKQIRNSLEHTGLSIKRAENLAWLHDYLYTHSAAAILINRIIPERHCINIPQHLKQAKSENIVMTYRLVGKKMDVDAFWNISGNTNPTGLHRCEAILASLKNSIFSSSESEQDDTVPQNHSVEIILPEEFRAGLSGKQNRILSILAEAGSAGVSVEDIATLVWPVGTGSHRDDIQSYISLLRRHLTVKAFGRYLIIRTGKRYNLKEMDAIPSG